jgi:hypothetical protein
MRQLEEIYGVSLRADVDAVLDGLPIHEQRVIRAALEKSRRGSPLERLNMGELLVLGDEGVTEEGMDRLATDHKAVRMHVWKDPLVEDCTLAWCGMKFNERVMKPYLWNGGPWTVRADCEWYWEMPYVRGIMPPGNDAAENWAESQRIFDEQQAKIKAEMDADREARKKWADQQEKEGHSDVDGYRG